MEEDFSLYWQLTKNDKRLIINFENSAYKLGWFPTSSYKLN